MHFVDCSIAHSTSELSSVSQELAACGSLGCRPVAVGVIAVGSKVAVVAKSAGGVSGLLKGAGALAAAGDFCAILQDSSSSMLGLP